MDVSSGNKSLNAEIEIYKSDDTILDALETMKEDFSYDLHPSVEQAEETCLFQMIQNL